MARTTTDQPVDAAAHEYAQRVKEALHDGRVFLFGSRANGTNGRNSDYDFLIVSPSFRGVHALDRPVGLYSLWEGPPVDLDLICATADQFEKGLSEPGSFVSSIMTGAIEL